MQAPDRWPTGRARRVSIIAGAVIALLIVIMLVWKIAWTPPPGREPGPAVVPVAPTPQQ